MIVVNPRARIGEWCDIHQGVNIGENIEKGSCPQIGDNVWIGPGAKLFGAITIGSNSMIGANAVVNKSYPDDGVVLVGVPAKVIGLSGNVYYKQWKGNKRGG